MDIKIMRSLMFTILFGTIAVMSNSQTVQWSVRPSSAALDNSGNLVKYRQNGKVGLKTQQGSVVAPASYDFISDFKNGYAIACDNYGDKQMIKAIIHEGDYYVQDVLEELYATRYMYFSEGMMCVSDNTGMEGFIGADGSIAIPCQYKTVHPFSNGLASVTLRVKGKDKVYYITSSTNEISVEPGYGDLVFGSTFSNGQAVVYTMNRKGYIINLGGRTVGKYKTAIEQLKVNSEDYSIYGMNSIRSSETTNIPVDEEYSVYSSDGKYGYKKNGKIFLKAQLDKAEPFRGGFAVVNLHGYDGILQVLDGSFSGSVENTKLSVRGGNSEKAYYSLSIPNEMVGANLKLKVYDVNGQEIPVNAISNYGEERKYSISPQVAKNLMQEKYNVEVWSEGLQLWQDNLELAFNHIADPIPSTASGSTVPTKSSNASRNKSNEVALAKKGPILKASAPVAKSKKANANDMFTVGVSVNNSGDQNGRTSVTLYIDGKSIGTRNIDVRSRGNAQAIFTVPVKKERHATGNATLSKGTGSAKTQIHLKPFY